MAKSASPEPQHAALEKILGMGKTLASYTLPMPKTAADTASWFAPIIKI